MTADTLMARYGRSKTYNSDNWDTVGGSLSDSTYLKFKSLADAKYPQYLNKTTLTLPNGDIIDLPHFWAVISSQIQGYGTIGGWGGDLVQLSGDIAKGATATFPSGRFGAEDWVSDADAYNLSLTGSYVPNLRNYWNSITEKNRVTKFTSKYSNISSRYTSVPGFTETLMLGVLESNEGSTSASLTSAETAMQNYLDGVKNS